MVGILLGLHILVAVVGTLQWELVHSCLQSTASTASGNMYSSSALYLPA